MSGCRACRGALTAVQTGPVRRPEHPLPRHKLRVASALSQSNDFTFGPPGREASVLEMANHTSSSFVSRQAKPAKRSPRKARLERQIAVDAIDWSFAIRPINVEHLDRLLGAASLPAIKVWEFQRNQYRGIDGYHRWRMLKDSGADRVTTSVCHFPKGIEGEKAFEFECVESNMQHGLPLTREERDRAIVRIWARWGRSGARSDGETLDRVGRLFNLTKQRIHQILATKQAAESESLLTLHLESGHQTDTGQGPAAAKVVRLSVAGRFSSFGRFSAATRRISRLLANTDFVVSLFRERQSEVFDELNSLRSLIDELLRRSAKG
jgi:hypothetical protein